MSGRFHRGFLCVCALALAIAPAARAAEFVTSAVGGSGGISYGRDCGAGGVLIGLQAKWGFWIDQVTPVCKAIAADGTLGAISTLGRVGGGGGGSVGTRMCPDGKVLIGLATKWNVYVDNIALICQNWNPPTKTRGAPSSIASTSGMGSSGPFKHSSSLLCPNEAGKVAKGIRGKANVYLDSLALVCDAWNQ